MIINTYTDKDNLPYNIVPQLFLTAINAGRRASKSAIALYLHQGGSFFQPNPITNTISR
ncbi:hypothetical protein [Nostoc sp.]|uniref:hypothetical protein n=1 Tax=Nostoc sp. TaxID=1180 RepID=UPI002FF51EDB